MGLTFSSMNRNTTTADICTIKLMNVFVTHTIHKHLYYFSQRNAIQVSRIVQSHIIAVRDTFVDKFSTNQNEDTQTGITQQK